MTNSSWPVISLPLFVLSEYRTADVMICKQDCTALQCLDVWRDMRSTQTPDFLEGKDKKTGN